MHIGPRSLQAPEIDGRTPYTNKADIWSFALTVVGIILPDVTRWPEWQHHAPQTPAFMATLFKKFDECARGSPLAKALGEVLSAMLNPNPDLRISAEDALKAWPHIADTEKELTASDTVDSTLPSAKKAKPATGSIQTGM